MPVRTVKICNRFSLVSYRWAPTLLSLLSKVNLTAQSQTAKEPSLGYFIVKLFIKKKSDFIIQKLRQVTGVFKEPEKSVFDACSGDISTFRIH